MFKFFNVALSVAKGLGLGGSPTPGAYLMILLGLTYLINEANPLA